MRTRQNYKASWVVKCSDANKTHWGETKTWSGMSSTSVKMITMQTGARTSLKYNTLKDEMLICVSGNVTAYHADEKLIKERIGDLQVTNLSPGTALIVQSECLYRLEANDTSTIIEVSAGRDGCVRFEDDYGREVTSDEYVEKIIKKWWRD